MSSRRFCSGPLIPGSFSVRGLTSAGVVGLPAPSCRSPASCRRRWPASRPPHRGPPPSTHRTRGRGPPCHRRSARPSAVPTTLPSRASGKVGVSAWPVSSWTRPSLGPPTKPLDAALNGPSRAANDRLRIVTIGGVRRGDQVGGDQDRMAGRGIDGRVIGATVAGPAAAVAVDRRIEPNEQLQTARERREHHPHQHGIPARVRDVVGRRSCTCRSSPSP